MIRRLPFKKEHLTGPAAMILLLLGYQLAFKNTLESWQLNTCLKKELAQSTDVSTDPGYEQRKSKNLDKVIDLYRADTSGFRNITLSSISDIAEKQNVKLTAVPTRDPLYQTSKRLIQKLDLEGDYNSLMKVLQKLQQAKDIGIIRSATIKSVIDQSGKKKMKKLTIALYFEYYISGS